MRRPSFPRVLPWAFTALVLCGLPARAIIVQAGEDSTSDSEMQQASHQEAVKHPAVAALHLLGGREPVPFAGAAVYIGTSHDGRKGLLLTAARLLGFDHRRPGASAYERIQVVFRPHADEAQGRAEVPVERALIHPHFTRHHHAVLRIPERYRDDLPSIKSDIAILEFDFAAHGAKLKAAGIVPVPLDRVEAKRPPAPIGAERKAAGTGLAALDLVESKRDASLGEERKAAGTGLAAPEPAPGAPAAALHAAAGFALGGGWKGSETDPAAPEPADDLRNAAGLEAGFIGFGVYGTHRTLLIPDNTRAHFGRTLVSRGEFLGCEVLLNLAPMTREAVEEVETRRQDHGVMNRFEPQATLREARLSAATGPQRLETHRAHAVMAAGDHGGPLLLDAPDGITRLAGIGSRGLFHRVALQGDKGPEDGWAIVSIWEPVGVHRPWIEGMRKGQVAGHAYVLEPRGGQWRRTDDEEEKKLDGAGCSSCAVM